MTHSIKVKTSRRSEFVDITPDIRDIVEQSNVNSGVCYVYVPHTTAGVTINEGADPDVVTDILSTLDRLIPEDPSYLHIEGNSDSHMKTALIGSSETIIIENGQLQLGTWQAIFFCEFDGGRNRTVRIKIMKSS